jgi:hypothetical protein
MARRLSSHLLHTHRKNSSLSGAVDHRVNLYSIAAAAASVSMLALAEPAEAKVVITNVNIPITQHGISIDLNQDGVTDLKFKYLTNPGASRLASYLSVEPIKGNAVVANAGYVSALMRSAKIGPSAHFGGNVGNSSLLEEKSCDFYGCKLFGKWGGNHPNRFVGVKFQIHGATHYGWVRVTVSSNKTEGDALSGTVTEYGYETIANKRALAGVPSNNAQEDEARNIGSGPSLGALALGTDGLALWRRE